MSHKNTTNSPHQACLERMIRMAINNTVAACLTVGMCALVAMDGGTGDMLWPIATVSGFAVGWVCALWGSCVVVWAHKRLGIK